MALSAPRPWRVDEASRRRRRQWRRNPRRDIDGPAARRRLRSDWAGVSVKRRLRYLPSCVEQRPQSDRADDAASVAIIGRDRPASANWPSSSRKRSVLEQNRCQKGNDRHRPHLACHRSKCRQAIGDRRRHPVRLDIHIREDDLGGIVARQAGNIAAGMAAGAAEIQARRDGHDNDPRRGMDDRSRFARW